MRKAGGGTPANPEDDSVSRVANVNSSLCLSENEEQLSAVDSTGTEEAEGAESSLQGLSFLEFLQSKSKSESQLPTKAKATADKSLALFTPRRGQLQNAQILTHKQELLAESARTRHTVTPALSAGPAFCSHSAAFVQLPGNTPTARHFDSSGE